MAQTVSDILIKFKTLKDDEVGRAFKRITREARGVEKSFQKLTDTGVKKLRAELNSLKSANVNSIASMKAQRNALMGLRDMADVAGNEFKQLTAEIKQMDAALAASQGKKAGRGARLAGIAKGAGAVAAGGIFGGAEGAIGAGIGLAVSQGNPITAAVGAAIGAQVKMVREGLSDIAEFSAQLALQRKALGLVIGDTVKFAKSQEFLLDTSRKLAIPQDVITRQFTALTASVIGAGQSVEDAEEVFLAIASGIRGTGGSLEDMKAAMRATSQVFSKGKVSAEELRQQLGERLPGAFTLFAASMDKTPAELDKALEQGKVTLDDFMKFAKKLFATYGVNAEILAQGPEAAGDRLKTAMAELKDSIGSLLRPIGAGFQKVFGAIVEDINKAIQKFREFMGLGTENQRKKLERIFESANDKVTRMIRRGQDGKELDRALQQRDKALYDLEQFYLNNPTGMNTEQSGSNKGDGGDGGGGELSDKDLQKNLDFIEKTRQAEEKAEQEKYNAFLDFQLLTGQITQEKFDQIKLDQQAVQLSKEFGVNLEYVRELLQRPIEYEGVMAGIKDYFDSIKTGAEEVREAVTSAFKNMEDAIVNFVMTGKLNFAEFTRSILADMARIIVRQAFIKPLLGAIFPNFADGGVVENAMGNVYGSNGIQKFARGGVVHSPTIFPFKNGIGLMGEAGSEAILPLKRTKQGKLGVESSGGGGNVVNVSVDAGGTSAQGNTMKANQLGKLIGTAIEAELIKQKRPGGILYT